MKNPIQTFRSAFARVRAPRPDGREPERGASPVQASGLLSDHAFALKPDNAVLLEVAETAKPGAAVATKKKREKREKRNVSFKDVQIAYLMGGVGEIERLVKDGRVSKPSIRRALTELAASGRNVEPLERWVDEQFGAAGSGRGRTAASAGDSRTYKAQQIGSGGAFLRLPLEVLGVKKGGTVRVRFERDSIVVSR